jgi:hypothetical protein
MSQKRGLDTELGVQEGQCGWGLWDRILVRGERENKWVLTHLYKETS